jgi:hypothetical protein
MYKSGQEITNDHNYGPIEHRRFQDSLNVIVLPFKLCPIAWMSVRCKILHHFGFAIKLIQF